MTHCSSRDLASFFIERQQENEAVWFDKGADDVIYGLSFGALNTDWSCAGLVVRLLRKMLYFVKRRYVLHRIFQLGLCRLNCKYSTKKAAAEIAFAASLFNKKE